jgi:PAS domain S-box-containing protein
MQATQRFRYYYYLIIIFLILLTCGATYTIVELIQNSKANTHLIYLLSRQRTRTQRVIKNTLLLNQTFKAFNQKNQTKIKLEFQTALRDIEKTETELENYAPILNHYPSFRKGQKLLADFLTEIQIIDRELNINTQVPDYQVDIHLLYDAGNQYLDLIIEVIDKITLQNEQAQVVGIRLTMAFGAMFLVSFGLITVFIFNPAIQKLARAFLKIQTKNDDLLAFQEELRQNLETLHQSQIKLEKAFAEIQDLYDNAPVGYHSLNSAGLIIKMNQTELQWLGYTAEEVINRKYFWELVLDGNAEDFAERFQILQKEGLVDNLLIKMRRKDGSLLAALLNSTALYDSNGNFIMSRSSIIDRTQAAQAEQKAQKFQEMLFETEKLAKIGSWEVDLQTMYLTWTPGTYQIYDIPLNQTPDLQFINQLYSPENQRILNQILARSVQRQINYEFELPFRNQQGNLKWSRAIGKPIVENGQVSKLQGFLQDITERKLAEIAIQEKNAELQALSEQIQQNLTQLHQLNQTLANQNTQLNANNQLKNKLFAIIAHDLRSPFATLSGLIDLLEMGVLSEAEIAVVLAELKKKNTNISATLDNLLLWANSLLDGEKIEWLRLDLAQIVQTTLDFLQILAQPKQIQLVNEIPANQFVLADKNMLTVILRNLTANGIKFTPAGGKITIQSTENEQVIEVWVADTGLGMSLETQASLFKERTTTKGTNQEKGTGLGLLICKEFVEKMGGKIWVESQLNVGSTFKFTLNLKP